MSEVFCGAEPCSMILNATCVFYRGEDLLYIGVKTNDNLHTVIGKINQAFQNAGVGYAFTNGIVQPDPNQPVQLGGSLVQDTIIGGNYTLTLDGNLKAAKHITTGGTASQFVKGDGSLDNTTYQPVGNYITGLTGDGTASGPGLANFTLSTVNFAPGTFGSESVIPVITVNSKGLVTNVTPKHVQIPPQPLNFTGDVVGSGFTGSSVQLLLQNVNLNPVTSQSFLKFSVNAKGLVTGTSLVVQNDIISALGYTPVPTTRTITINGTTFDLSQNRSWNISIANIILTTLGNNGPATYDPLTGNFNIPEYTISGLGGVPSVRNIEINGVQYDLTQDRSWTVGDLRSDQSYSDPSWITSIGWNKITNTPTTVSGYGITDVYTKTESDNTFYPLLTNPAGYLTSETDPVFNAWLSTNPLAGLASETWVTQNFYPLNSNPAGYLTSFTETDPVFTAWLATNPFNGHATETWVNTNFYDKTTADGKFYPLSSNPAGYLTSVDLAGYVPYTGATQNVNLSEFGIFTGHVTLDNTPTNIPTTQGTMYWNVDNETISAVLNGYTMQIGEDTFYPVKNKTGVAIPKGTAVRFAGTLGNSGRLLIAPFIANGALPSSLFMGVTAENIPNGEDGKVLWFGKLRGINTNAFNEGDVLYASTTVAGGFQTAVPVAPNNIVQIAAVVTKSATVGEIFIRPQIGSNINNDEGVKITSPATGQLLQLQSNGLWEN